jgi:hypothetical protein
VPEVGTALLMPSQYLTGQQSLLRLTDRHKSVVAESCILRANYCTMPGSVSYQYGVGARLRMSKTSPAASAGTSLDVCLKVWAGSAD